MTTPEVKEGSTAYVGAAFKDKDGAAQQPSSASYKIDCLTTGAVIRADTVLVPVAGVATITLAGADVALQDQANRREQRRITVTALYAGTQAVIDDYRYDVINLGGVT